MNKNQIISNITNSKIIKEDTICHLCNAIVQNPNKIYKIRLKTFNCSQDKKIITTNIPYNNIKIICNDCTINDSYEKISNLSEKHKLSFDNIDYNFQYFLYKNDIYILKKEWRNYVRNILNIKIRKEQLFKKLAEQKLEYKKNGICDAYIFHGLLDIDDVIENLSEKQKQYNHRLEILINALNKRKITYNPEIPVFQKYLKNHLYADQINLNSVIEEAQLEKILIDETNYIDLLKRKDINDAREISIIKCNTNKKITKNIIDKITIKFD
jgi:hypothetical protein